MRMYSYLWLIICPHVSTSQCKLYDVNCTGTSKYLYFTQIHLALRSRQYYEKTTLTASSNGVMNFHTMIQYQ